MADEIFVGVKNLPVIASIFVFAISMSVMAQGNGMALGNVRILEVKGTPAIVTTLDGLSSPAVAGEFIREGASVKTGPGSSVSLLFDNGALVVVEPETEFSIEKFATDPFSYEGIDYKTISKEPSRSVTKLKVSEGLIAVDVVPLNGKSKFDVATPVGSAGIRGTRFGVGFSRANNSSSVAVVVGSVAVSLPRGLMQVVAAGMGIGVGPGGFQALAQPVLASLMQQISQIIQALRPIIPNNPFAGAPPQAPGGDAGTDDTGDQGSINAGQTIPGSGNRPSGG